MLIRKLDIWALNLKFRYPFKHKLATHEASENLVVRVVTGEGVTGFGEGIPRSFVTGETLSASLTHLQEVLGPAVLASPPASPETLLPTLGEWRQTCAADTAPGAFCALETALLDAAGRTWNRPLSDFFGPRRASQVTYSAVLPLSSGPQLSQFLKLVRSMGMRYVKLKVGEDHDLETLALARQELGPEVDLRVDANGAWEAPEAIRRIREMEPFRLSAVEQPVAKSDFEGLRQVQEAVTVPIMADESLCTLEDARRLIDLQACRMFNLRLSKCGGPLQTARLQDLAQAAGVSCQLGCQVGETSILAAAGRHYACTAPGLVYLEGSFAPYLLLDDPVETPVVFGPQGAAPPLTGPGLGVQIKENLLEELATAHITLA